MLRDALLGLVTTATDSGFVERSVNDTDAALCRYRGLRVRLKQTRNSDINRFL